MPRVEDAPLGPIVIEDVTPRVDGGRWAVKRVVGDAVTVSALVFKDGHDLLSAAVLYRAESDADWLEAPMEHLGWGRWEGVFEPLGNEGYRFTVVAWLDAFGTWRREMRKRLDANQDVTVEVQEGLALVRDAAQRADAADRVQLDRALGHATRARDASTMARVLLARGLAATVGRWQPRRLLTRHAQEFPVWVDRPAARFASWYEFFPRSEGADGTRSGTLGTAAQRLPAIAQMGFDVVYLAPIHPVGRTSRKGRGNTLTAGPDDPGSPWAIGGEAGGHTAVHPDLGTLEDFEQFVSRAASLGLEVALDLAFQCSPDHPWLREHPEWFFRRPDGSIKHAENPPKKYQDIVPIDFWGDHREALWTALLDVAEFWIARGIQTFRVDNPHTKPVAFWQWFIERVHSKHPSVIFLSEAFTAAPMMRALAKVGFTQSYTYFTWKISKAELAEYMRELVQTDVREYFRAHLWPNTPDILHAYLQRERRRPAFKIRAVLASTLSSLWGIYSGYELMENTPAGERTEEYLHSEKYELRPRDWTQPDMLVAFIARLNRARRANPALQLYDNLRFVHVDSPDILAYVKATPDRSNVVIVAVNLDAEHTREGDLWIDPAELGVRQDEEYLVRDALTDEAFRWRGGKNWVRLDPFLQPAHVLVIERLG